ncbi:MAG: 23S rRNA (guanosine(2251)-2'-O)-methyltransferase RlmB [Pseudomonadota bacterium]
MARRNDKRSGTPARAGTHHRDRRRGRGSSRTKSAPGEDLVRLYGLHSVREALANPKRRWVKLSATLNALNRLDLPDLSEGNPKVSLCQTRELDKLVGRDAVHQGLVLEAEPLDPASHEDLLECDLLLVLDQITDPHNVGAILRSACAMNVGGVITTHRNSATESGVLAKSASGALDLVPIAPVRNLSKTLDELNDHGFTTVGLDSEGPQVLGDGMADGKVALVLGAEGKGLREKTRHNCAHLARLDLPGKIKSLNVSNAAALALYALRRG